MQGVARGRLCGRAGEFQPGHHHDRSRIRGSHLYRADHCGSDRGDHGTRKTGCHFAYPGRANGIERCDGIEPQRRVGATRGEVDWRKRPGDCKRRRSAIVQGSDVAHRAGPAAFRRGAFSRRYRSDRRRDRNIPAHYSAGVHSWRDRRWHRL